MILYLKTFQYQRAVKMGFSINASWNPASPVKVRQHADLIGSWNVLWAVGRWRGDWSRRKRPDCGWRSIWRVTTYLIHLKDRERQIREGYALSLQEDRTDDVSVFVSVINEANGKAEIVTDHINVMNELRPQPETLSMCVWLWFCLYFGDQISSNINLKSVTLWEAANSLLSTRKTV